MSEMSCKMTKMKCEMSEMKSKMKCEMRWVCEMRCEMECDNTFIWLIDPEKHDKTIFKPRKPFLGA
jgi:hypothetical protein